MLVLFGCTFSAQTTTEDSTSSDTTTNNGSTSNNTTNSDTTSNQTTNNDTTNNNTTTNNGTTTNDTTTEEPRPFPEGRSIKNDARVGYQIFVDTFANGDLTNDSGVISGDIQGITQNLDYLKTNLNVDVLWLTPVHESGSYHGYDVDDFYTIRESFGGLDAYRELLEEAHKREIFVMLDLVINHTSTTNEWFKKSAAGNSKYRDYYRWTSTKVTDSRYEKNGAYYFAVFWDQMPDLNYDNEATYNEMLDVCKYWLDLGVDGFRVDGAKHVYNYGDWGGKELYEGSDDLGALNFNKNLEFFNKLHTDLVAYDSDCFMTLEVLDYSSDTIAYYLEQGVDSCFDFAMRGNIVGSVNNGTGSNLAGVYSNELINFNAKNGNNLNSLILSNHDINRVMSDVGSDDKAKVCAAIQMLLPGLSWIYSGDELGMTGTNNGKDNGDLGYRQPYIWDNKYQTSIISLTGNTNGYDSHNSSLASASSQLLDSNSMLRFYKDMTNLKSNDDVISFGDYQNVYLDDAICSFTRSYKGKTYLCCINTSSASKTVNYSLSGSKLVYSNKASNTTSSITLQGYGVIVIETEDLEPVDLASVVIHYKGNSEYNVWEWSTSTGRWVNFDGVDSEGYKTATINIEGLDLVYFRFLIGKDTGSGYVTDGGDRSYILKDDGDRICHIYIDSTGTLPYQMKIDIDSSWGISSSDTIGIWAWKDGVDGSWISASIVNNQIVFDLPRDLDYIIIAVMNSSTVDWNNKRKQTVNLTVSNGEVITAITWKLD